MRVLAPEPVVAAASAPSAPAQVHQPALAPSAAEQARAALTHGASVLGASLIAGAALLVVLAVQRSAMTSAVIPVTLFVGLTLSFAAALRARRAADLVDDAALRRALALLFAGAALVGPLALHGLVQAHLWAPSPYDALVEDRSFAGWVRTSLLLSGPAHGVFAIGCAWRGLVGRVHGPRLVTIGVWSTVAAAYTVPAYGIYVGLPMLYVALTAALLLRGARVVEERVERVLSSTL